MERIKKYEPLWGKWTVKRKLGEGSFGAVYEAESEKFGNKSSCAIKLISFKNAEMLQGMKNMETLSADELEQRKIEEAKKNVREAVLMEKLQGRDNIVTIYDYDIFPGESTTDVIIRMELLTNLNDYMDLHQTNSEEELRKRVIKLGLDMCKALKDCERENIVHRDIKPDNIFINKNETFKLGDFGLSRKMTKSTSFSLRKSAGTPLYMAPEALGWGSKIDYLSDIYSLGIVMYQMLNDGKIPFVEDMDDFSEVDEAIGRRGDGEILPPPKYEDGALWKIIEKAIQFKKEDRYQSAEKIIRELEEVRGSEKNGLNSTKECCEVEEKNVLNSTGDILTFGAYPQSRGSATIEPLEWIVLKKEGKSALLISKNVIDCKKFHRSRADVTWEKSDVRQWLNEYFYNKAFDEEERRRIRKTLLKQSENLKYQGKMIFKTIPKTASETEDYIFFLDTEEVEELFWGKDERIANPTEYAIRQGVYGSADRGTAWWTRSLGKNIYSTVFVKNNGDIEYAGTLDICDFIGVRPAMWIDIEK